MIEPYNGDTYPDRQDIFGKAQRWDFFEELDQASGKEETYERFNTYEAFEEYFLNKHRDLGQ